MSAETTVTMKTVLWRVRKDGMISLRERVGDKAKKHLKGHRKRILMTPHGFVRYQQLDNRANGQGATRYVEDPKHSTVLEGEE